jgi:cystathionine beta-lyase/cystathionine gamma-synthase
MTGNREPLMQMLRRAIHYSLSDGVLFRSGCAAIVVGTILNLINQGDAILEAASLNWIKIVLTYFVPYAVSTYGAVSFRMSRQPT